MTTPASTSASSKGKDPEISPDDEFVLIRAQELRKSYKIDLRGWGKDIDLSNLEHLIEPILNAYILSTIEMYETHNYKGIGLLYSYQTDFDGWTKEVFKISHKGVRSRLRNHLIYNGV